MNSFKTNLKANTAQVEAINHRDGPALVIAGAGAGKTRVVTSRVLNLVENGVDPSSILVVTFTNKAAEEMKSRIFDALKDKDRGLREYSYIHISTFHKLGVSILRESICCLKGYNNNFTIYDDDDCSKIVKSCVKKIFGSIEESKKFKEKISVAKNLSKTPEECISGYSEEFVSVYSAYQQELREANAVDFDDLLFLTKTVLTTNDYYRDMYQRRWKYLLIDEYQDTNDVQYEISKILTEKSNNIFVVGDPDQSIYSWRGANIGNILNFTNNFPNAKIIKLEQNYRSTNNILNAANGLITNNSGRSGKKLWSTLGDGDKIHFALKANAFQEASFIVDKIKRYVAEGASLNDIVIFYRTNFQSRTFEDVLLMAHIPYIIVGGISFYQRKEIKDILAFLKMALFENDAISFTRTINVPKRGIGKTTLEKILLATQETKETIFETVTKISSEESSMKINKNQKEQLRQYVKFIEDIRQLEASKASVKEIISFIVDNSNYIEDLKNDMETFEDRKNNVYELIAKATEWEKSVENPSSVKFLEDLVLNTSLEGEEDGDKLRLMTIHNGKGLEFSVVFISGMEENLFPHVNCLDEEKNIEEERRLFYVGITRAKKHLYLSASLQRMVWGNMQVMFPSRFLKEIPSQYLQKVYT